MFQDKFVFSQLTSFLDRNHFNYLVRKYGGDKYVKHFTCWNQLLALMFGLLSNRDSLRDLIVGLEAHQKKCFHLGLGSKPLAKTTFATANQNRDLSELLEKTNFNDVKELDSPLIPGLFD